MRTLLLNYEFPPVGCPDFPHKGATDIGED